MNKNTNRDVSGKCDCIRRFFSNLGPGLVTGAADDDPSGIATYSIVGAQFGMSLLWLSWLTLPLMAAVQMMCARIGMVTGVGLAEALSKKVPRPLLMLICVALLVANTVNIAADLAGMADAAQLVTHIPNYWFVLLFGLGTGWSIVRFCYAHIANALKWLALSLVAYIVTAFLLNPDWSRVVHATFVPELPRGNEMWQAIVAILGTTISPYLFFWQSAQEVEEEKYMGRIKLSSRKGASPYELHDRMLDVGAGALLSNTVMFFIILTAALTLHAKGMTDISSSKEAAEALRPLAGELAMVLYSVAIIAVGLLAIPTLAGSTAYAFAETMGWPLGLNKKFYQAKCFYVVILVSVVLGVALNLLHLNPLKALFWSAIINGIVAPFALMGIVLVARDKVIMIGQPSSRANQVVVSLATLFMFIAAGIMLLA